MYEYLHIKWSEDDSDMKLLWHKIVKQMKIIGIRIRVIMSVKEH